jgi:hypothetical protein
VIEITHSKTLWYNFNFFKNIFGYASLEVVQNQHLITKWVEDNVMNAVRHTQTNSNRNILKVEDTLENGIRLIEYQIGDTFDEIDDIIENGVKEMKPLPSQTGNKDWSEYSHGREDRTKPFNDYLNDTLEKGVKIN